MIDLYTASTGNGRRAAIALAEGGLAHRIHRLDLHNNEHKTPEFLKINPASAIPVITDDKGPDGGQICVAQSGAIVLYCAEKSGTLIPVDPLRRVVAFQWFMQAATDVAPASSAIYQLSKAPEKSAANNSFFEQRFLSSCEVVDQRLAGREYLADEYSIADIMLYPFIATRRSMLDSVKGFGNLKTWAQQISERPNVSEAVAANG